MLDADSRAESGGLLRRGERENDGFQAAAAAPTPLQKATKFEEGREK